jgi:hypothetical protein
MAWKTFTFYERSDMYSNELPVEQVLDNIEAQGYEIRFVFRDARQYTVLARKKAH